MEGDWKVEMAGEKIGRYGRDWEKVGKMVEMGEVCIGEMVGEKAGK